MDAAKEKRAIEYLKAFEPQTEPYYLCYSGGKDSDVIRILASLAGVKHDIENNHTTVDAPETVRYIRSIPNVHINYPKFTMWELIRKKLMPPTRLVRYCCAELKEKGGKGRVKITGVRREESVMRMQNGGVVKVIGKPKSTQKLAEEIGVDFTLTNKGGGGIKPRQHRFSKVCRILLQNNVNAYKSYSGLDGARRLGISRALRLQI